MKSNVSPYVFPGIKKGTLPKSFIKSKKSRIPPLEILKIVAEYHYITADDIIRKNNKREVSDARHMYCAIMKIDFRYTYESIGDLLNGRDHSTVMHSVSTFRDRSKYEEGYKDQYEKILEKINFEIN